MKRNSLIAALAAASLVSAGTAYGWSLNPAQWFARTSTTSAAPQAATPAGGKAPDATLVATTSAPDYRAIFERFGPAVVGVTVEVRTGDGMSPFEFGIDDVPLPQPIRARLVGGGLGIDHDPLAVPRLDGGDIATTVGEFSGLDFACAPIRRQVLLADS